MEGLPFIDLFPKAREVLMLLHQRGKKIGLVTASYRNVVEPPLKNNKIIDLFDAIVTGDQIKAHKPDPESLLAALQVLSMPPGKAIMVGDSPKDLMAANNADMDSLLFFPPEHELQHSRDELEACRPTYTIRNWQELLDQLQ
jgi:pyrophosphatase PpaX